MTKTTTKKQPISPAEKKAFDAVVEYIDKNGISPNKTQVANRLEITPSTATTHINNLIAKGWLKQDGGQYSLEVVGGE
jgi:Mn-dependent DtxR family transcriptional regulator